MSAGYYIYYRIPQEQTVQAAGAVRLMQDDIARNTGVQGRLLCRRDDPCTWMEIYEGIVDAADFEDALAAAVKRAGFDALLAPGSRRVTEVFQPVQPAP